MQVSGQERGLGHLPEKGPRARMQRRMLDAAIALMQGGTIPSVSDVAQAAEVSRATAYRYFPSQAAMIQAVVNEALGPVLGWTAASDDPAARVRELLDFAYPRMERYEATHRAALSLALAQWARRQAGTLGVEAPVVRGNRRALLREAAAPLRGRLDAEAFDRLTQSLSLLFGIEAIIVLKDIWGLEADAARRVAVWAAGALVGAALAEPSAGATDGSPRGSRSKRGAKTAH